MLILGILSVKAYFNNYKYFKIACCLKLKMNKKDENFVFGYKLFPSCIFFFSYLVAKVRF